MKKRILALVLAGVMALGLAACSGNTGSTASENPQSSTSGTADSDFKVGAIYINKKSDTAGYTYAHHKGITKAMEELGLDVDTQLVIVDEVQENYDEVSAAVDNLVGEGCDIIFGISFGYLDAMNDKERDQLQQLLRPHLSGPLPHRRGRWFEEPGDRQQSCGLRLRLRHRVRRDLLRHQRLHPGCAVGEPQRHRVRQGAGRLER